MGGGELGRPDVVHAQRDNLLLPLHQHPAEWLVVSVTELDGDACQALVGLQMRDERVSRLLGAREEEVDSIRAQQDRALEPRFQTDIEHRLAQLVPVGQVDEAVPRDVNDHAHHHSEGTIPSSVLRLVISAKRSETNSSRATPFRWPPLRPRIETVPFCDSSSPMITM